MHKHLPFKNTLLEELGNGRFVLVDFEDRSQSVVDIEFNNRKAARNWARSRGFLIIDPPASASEAQPGRN